MSGLEVVDDQTFTVTLTGAVRAVPGDRRLQRLLPAARGLLRRPRGRRQARRSATARSRPRRSSCRVRASPLTRYDDYAGDEPAKADSVEFRVYTDIDTAYTDVQGGNLDIVDSIPPDAIATAPDEFGDRYVETESSSFTYLGLPDLRPALRRQAGPSGVLDGDRPRGRSPTAIFDGTRAPANSVIAPVVDGYREDACKYCEVDVEAGQRAARRGRLRHAASRSTCGSTPAPATTRGSRPWATSCARTSASSSPSRATSTSPSTCRCWTRRASPARSVSAGAWTTRARRTTSSRCTPRRRSPPAGSNTAFYSNPEFDELVEQGNQAGTNEEAIELYQQAEDLLLEDMPIMPMFFGLEQTVWSENVDNVNVDIFGRVDVAVGDRQAADARTTARPDAGAYLPHHEQVRPGARPHRPRSRRPPRGTADRRRRMM